ncbi:LysM peptidoglycan-binding domain-containing protein [Paenibacillus sp. SI8]|uniref:LysM peptidoglycan-binding domain-containing protein n=1 Tax=unclassified Paenibacillus TaxID=185978 RepID=UPI0034677295
MYMAYSDTHTTLTPHRSQHTMDRLKSTTKHIRKLFVFLLFITILGIVFSCGAIVQAYAGEGQPAVASKGEVLVKAKTNDQIVIQRGDTLWGIASSHMAKGENIRSYIDKIYVINHLQSSTLHEGQVLVLP